QEELTAEHRSVLVDAHQAATQGADHHGTDQGGDADADDGGCEGEAFTGPVQGRDQQTGEGGPTHEHAGGGEEAGHGPARQARGEEDQGRTGGGGGPGQERCGEGGGEGGHPVFLLESFAPGTGRPSLPATTLITGLYD